MKPAALAFVLALGGACIPEGQAPSAATSVSPSPEPHISPPPCRPDPPRTELGGREFLLSDGPVDAILEALRKADAPQLPPDGRMSPGHVCGGHVIGDGSIGVRFDHGAEMYYWPEGAPERRFLPRLKRELRDLRGRFIGFRGTTAGMLEADDRGPAVVIWLEGGFEIELYGWGRQPLKELLALGRTLVAAG